MPPDDIHTLFIRLHTYQDYVRSRSDVSRRLRAVGAFSHEPVHRIGPYVVDRRRLSAEQQLPPYWFTDNAESDETHRFRHRPAI